MPDNSKFSNFANGGVLDSDDIVVGLRSGVNTKFTYNGGLSPSVVVPIDQGGTGATNATEARANLGLAIGSDVQAWDTNLDGLSALASTGFVAQTAAGTFADRIFTGTPNEVDITNGNGIAGDPVLRLSSTIDAPGTLTIQSTVAIDSIIDDDSMSTASATNISTSEAIKAYVDAVAGGGFTVILTCLLGTTANLSGTYDNGTAGVGATLTNNTTQAALELDGVTVQVNDRVLVKDQTSTPDNGVYCLDEETEILTRDGFKHYTQVSKGDLVLTFNCETQKNEWQEACSINVFDVKDQEMLAMYGQKGHRSISTLNHRWPVKHRFSDEIRIVESKDLNHSHSILKAAELSQYPEEKTYDDEFVQLVAWFYTEGEVRKNNSGSTSTAVRISQSNTANPLYVSEIRDCLTHCFGEPADVMRRERGGIWGSEWREEDRTKNYGMIVFSLNTKAGECLTKIATGQDKIVSKEFLLKLTKKQLELFLKTSINADGHTRKTTGQITFGQKVRERAECFQYACILLGYPANITISSEGMHTVFLGTTKKCQPHLSATHTKYTGKVWCPTTQNSTWVARKDGYVFITGNTVTTVGDGSTDWVLTRATDYDTAAEIIPGTLIPISSGDTLGGSIWIESATVTTVGTDPIVFNIFAQPANTFVTLATNQTITGDKTFSGTVTVPTPTTDFEAATKAYVDANGGGGGNVGDIVDFAGTSAPSGCLVCDGSAVSRATYSALFSVIGTTWGIGDGTTTFNLPSASRMTTVGSGGATTATLGNAVGDTGGTETNTLTTAEMPSRSIYYATSSLTNHIGSNTGAAGYYPATSAATWNSGGGQAQNNMQPSMVVLRCIRYEPVATSTATAADQTAQEAAASSVVFTNPASQQFHPSAAKAWVVFNGVGTVAISASYNVTSITDNGTGDYTVNFTNAFSSINYSASGSCGFGTNPSYTSATVSYVGGPNAVPTASAWRFGTGQGAVSAEPGVRVDLPYISVQFFGELA